MNFIDRSVCDLTEVIFPNNLLHLKISGGRRIYVRLPELELPKHIKTLELRSLNALKQIILPGSKYVTSQQNTQLVRLENTAKKIIFVVILFLKHFFTCVFHFTEGVERVHLSSLADLQELHLPNNITYLTLESLGNLNYKKLFR